MISYAIPVRGIQLTDQIFQKGMKKQAEPKDMLTKRYQQFQRRLARHYLNLADGTATVAASSTGSGHGGSTEAGPPRQALGGLSQGQADGTDRLPRGVNGPNGTSTTNNINGASTSLSRNTIPLHNSRGAGSAPTTTTATSGSGGALSTRGNNNNGAAAFQIFSETGPASQAGIGLGNDAPPSHSSLAENPHWLNLAPDQQRRKENDGPVTAWNDRPLLNNNPAIGGALPSSSTARPLTSMVPVFVDEAFQHTSIHHDPPPPPQNTTGSTRPSGLSIRRQLDGEEGGREGIIDLGRIASNPLERHKQSASTSATPTAPPAQPPPQPPAQLQPPLAPPSASSTGRPL